MKPPLLIVRPGAIGDALLTIPALAALRAARPGEPVVFVAHPAVGPLVLREGLVDRFVARDAPASDALFAPTPTLAREHFEALSGAVAWSSDSDGRLRANLAALGARPLIVVPSCPAEGDSRHVAEYLAASLAGLGVRPPEQSLRTFSLPTTRAASRLGPRSPRPPQILLHLGSGSPRKNWPSQSFAALADALQAARGAELHVLGGPADEQVLAAFERATHRRFAVLHERPLVELADLLADCDLYVGNDSGISHLAGLSGAPTLALFGPTDPRLWHPLGPRVEVLRHEPLQALGVGTVLAAALTLLDRTTRATHSN